MSRKVEEYFKNNREEFYEKEPPAYVWDNLEKNLFAKPKPKSKFTRLYWISGIAATITVICTVALIWNSHYKIKKITADNQPIVEEQREYIRLISSKREELEKIKNSNPVIYADFVKDIDELQANYQQLKANLSKQTNQEAIAMAMILNLQAQMDALDQQLQVIEKFRKTKNNSHETQDI